MSLRNDEIVQTRALADANIWSLPVIGSEHMRKLSDAKIANIIAALGLVLAAIALLR